MKKLVSVLFVFAVAVTALSPRAAVAAVGDIWSLSGDMQIVSNPSPAIDPGAPGGGTATWSYYQDDLTTLFTTSVSGDITGSVNPELPDAGTGWVNPAANHVAMIRFDVAANPVPPVGTGDDKTNFGVGDVGGHATIGATWTTDHAGTFVLDWLGYNARNQETAADHEQGRTTTLVVTGPAGQLDSRVITGGVEDGLAGAYHNSTSLALIAGDSISIVQQGNEWSGLDLTISEIPEPSGGAILLLLAAMSWCGRRRARG